MTGFKSRKHSISNSIRSVPRKFREEVALQIKSTEFQEKFMIDKGLIGKEGRIEKVVKEVEMIEDYALEKMAANRANLLKSKPVILDPIRENQQN